MGQCGTSGGRQGLAGGQSLYCTGCNGRSHWGRHQSGGTDDHYPSSHDFFTNQKYTTCNDISVLSEYNSIDEKLDDICKNNKNLCTPLDAIKHSFNVLNTFSQSVKTENKKYLISYDNVNSNNINCQDISVNIEAKSDNEKYTISLSTCTSILEGNLKLIE